MRLPRAIAIAVAAALGLGLAIAAPAPAHAGGKDNRAEAEKLFRAGEQAFNAGDYIVAAQAFEEAYQLLPLAAIAFSTAQSYRLQYFVDKQPSRLKRAIDLYRLYVEQTPSGGRREDAVANLSELEPLLGRIEAEMKQEVKAQMITAQTTQLVVTTNVDGATATIDDLSGKAPFTREVAPGEHQVTVEAPGYFPGKQRALAVEGKFLAIEVNLEPRPGLVAVRTEAGAHVAVDGRPAGTTPLPDRLAIPAGKHFVSVTHRGRRSWGREIVLERGQSLDLDAPLRRTGQRTASYFVLGAGAAAIAGAGVTGFLAWRADGKAADLDRDRQAGTLDQAQLADYFRFRDQRDDRLGETYLLLGAAGVCAFAGAALFLFDEPPPESAPMTFAAPIVGPDVAGLQVSGRF
jgi:PEGA domain-containing protein